MRVNQDMRTSRLNHGRSIPAALWACLLIESVEKGNVLIQRLGSEQDVEIVVCDYKGIEFMP
jgi:hypothetical protein